MQVFIHNQYVQYLHHPAIPEVTLSHHTNYVCSQHRWEMFWVHGHLHDPALFPPFHPSQMYHLACCAMAIFVLQQSERKLIESLLPYYLSEPNYKSFCCTWSFVLIGRLWCSSVEQFLLYIIKWDFDLKCTWNAASQQGSETFLYLM